MKRLLVSLYAVNCLGLSSLAFGEDYKRAEGSYSDLTKDLRMPVDVRFERFNVTVPLSRAELETKVDLEFYADFVVTGGVAKLDVQRVYSPGDSNYHFLLRPVYLPPKDPNEVVTLPSVDKVSSSVKIKGVQVGIGQKVLYLHAISGEGMTTKVVIIPAGK